MVRLVILRLTESFFRNRGLYQLPLVLMIVLAGLYVLFSPRVYIARGTLYVQQQSLLSSLNNVTSGSFSWVSPAQMTLNEITELISTDAFVRAAISRTRLEEEITKNPAITNDAIILFRRSVWIQVLGENLVLIGAKYDEPRMAQEFSQATLDTFLRWKLDADQKESVVAQEFFAKLLDPYQTELDQARAELGLYVKAHPQPIRGDRPPDEQLELNLLQNRVAHAAQRIADVKDKEENARLAQTQAESVVYQNYRIVDAPKLPLDPEISLRDVLQTVIIFMVVGVMLAVFGVVGDILIDRSLRFPLDVRHGLELPVLAMVPDISVAPARSLRSRLLWWRRRKAPLVAPPQPIREMAPAPVFSTHEPNGRPSASLDELLERTRQAGIAEEQVGRPA